MHLWLSKLKKFILINTPYVFLITGFIVPPPQTISVWIEDDITITCLSVENINSFVPLDSLWCIFKRNYASSKHCREEKGARCALGDSPDVKALPGWGCPHLAHILPTSGAGAHHTLRPTAHHTTPLLVMGHCCTRKPRLLNHQIIREILIPLFSLSKFVSKHSLVWMSILILQNQEMKAD